MLRLALVLAVLALGPIRAEAGPTHAKTTAKSETKRTKAKASKSKAGKKSKRRKGRRSRGPDFSSIPRVYDGFPPGYSWPPKPAMLAAGTACELALDQAGVKWQRAKRVGRIVSPVEITDMMLGGIKYTNTWGASRTSTMDCQMALALAELGPDLHALGVREVRFGSIYDWSFIQGRDGRMLSRHALALAIDISGFVDDQGREVSIVKDYRRGDKLLLAVEQLLLASSHFHNIITPRHDPVGHDNHFHAEAVASFRGNPVATSSSPRNARASSGGGWARTL